MINMRHAGCTLADLEATLRQEHLMSPSVIVVGDVLQGLLAAGLQVGQAGIQTRAA